MEINRSSILEESLKKIQKLKLFSVYFKSDLIFDIYVRFIIIHDTFKDNPEIPINKLESFDLQYTSSVIELLQHVKSKNEKDVLLLLKELSLYQENVKEKEINKFEFTNYCSLLKNVIKNFYNIIQKDYDIDPFGTISDNEKIIINKNNNYINKNCECEFNFIPLSNESKFYSNSFFSIEKSLLGKLNKYEYNFTIKQYYCNNDIKLLLCEFNTIYFIYNINDNILFIVENSIIKLLDDSLININGNHINNKISNIESRISKTKIFIPDDTQVVLKELYSKICDVEFLETLNKIDEKNEILKAMINAVLL